MFVNVGGFMFLTTFAFAECLARTVLTSTETIDKPIDEDSLASQLQCAPDIVHLLNLLWVTPEDLVLDRSITVELTNNNLNKVVAEVSKNLYSSFLQIERNMEWLIVVNNEIQDIVDTLLELLYSPNVTAKDLFRYGTNTVRESLLPSAKTAVQLPLHSIQILNSAKQLLSTKLATAINKTALTPAHHDEVAVAVGMIRKRFDDSAVIFEQLQPKTGSLQELLYGIKTLLAFGEAEPNELIKLRPAITNNLARIFEKCSEIMLIAQCYADISRNHVVLNLRSTWEILHVIAAEGTQTSLTELLNKLHEVSAAVNDCVKQRQNELGSNASHVQALKVIKTYYIISDSWDEFKLKMDKLVTYGGQMTANMTISDQ